MRHFTSFLDHSPQELSALVARAFELKRGGRSEALRGKTLGLVFFNPSLRTRVSFETAMLKFGGHAVSLSAGGDMWSVETKEGAIMDGSKTEHVKDAVRVLGRYCDALAVRTFAGLRSLEEDLQEEVLSAFVRYSPVPVVSMESSMEHPCQALADMLTITERFRTDEKPSFTLTWAPHVKAIPMAVPHSALLAAANLGLDITLAHPPGFELAAPYLAHVRERASSLGGSLRTTADQIEACAGSDVIYAKNWAPHSSYGNPERLSEELRANASWKVDERKIKPSGLFLHCLPVRRNVEVSDEVIDGEMSGVYDQAENRLWAQVSVLEGIFEDAR